MDAIYILFGVAIVFIITFIAVRAARQKRNGDPPNDGGGYGSYIDGNTGHGHHQHGGFGGGHHTDGGGFHGGGGHH